MTKKKWSKPSIKTLSAKELAKHIKAAARSGDCIAGDYR